MTKITRSFTIDVEVYEDARRCIPNLSQAVEDALRANVAQTRKADTPLNKFKGVPRQLVVNAVKRLNNKGTASYPEFAPKIVGILNERCNTNITPDDLIALAMTEVVR